MSYVEKRNSPRISCHLYASMISRGKTYNGFIEDISERGLRYSMDSLVPSPDDFAPYETIKLILPIFSDEIINLHCEVKWVLSVSHEADTLIGMSVMNPSKRYNDLMKNIYFTRYL